MLQSAAGFKLVARRFSGAALHRDSCKGDVANQTGKLGARNGGIQNPFLSALQATQHGCCTTVANELSGRECTCEAMHQLSGCQTHSVFLLNSLQLTTGRFVQGMRVLMSQYSSSSSSRQ